MKSKQYLLRSGNILACDVKTMNSKLYSFEFSTSWVHDEKKDGLPLISLFFPTHFLSDDEISMCLYSYK